MTDVYPAGTDELVLLTVRNAGEDVTDYEVTIVPFGTPSTALTGWATPTSADDDQLGIRIHDLTPGTWTVHARIDSKVLLELGHIDIGR